MHVRLILVMLMPFIVFSQTLTEIADFGYNPGNLRMYSYVPEQIPKGIKVPMVVALHGCSQNANDLAENAGWMKLAEENNFIVLFPEQRTANNVSSCFNWYKTDDHSGERGESASIVAMMLYAMEHYPIDTSSISIYGVSAGAALAVSIINEHACVFKAGAILAGGPFMNPKNGLEGIRLMNGKAIYTAEEWGMFLSDKAKECPPKMIIIHGTEDKVVDSNNAQELLKQWSFAHQIDMRADASIKTTYDDISIERFSYNDGMGAEKMVYYRLENLGHKLSIDEGDACNEGGKEDMNTVDTGFFSTYYIARDFGLILSDCE